MTGIYSSDLINPIDHQLTSNDLLKPVLTTGPVNIHIDRLFANLAFDQILAAITKNELQV